MNQDKVTIAVKSLIWPAKRQMEKDLQSRNYAQVAISDAYIKGIERTLEFINEADSNEG